MTKPQADHQNSERTFQHLQSLRQDIREEMKYRIQQRDTYSIQMTLALGTLVGIAATSVAIQTKNAGATSDVTSIVNLAAYRSIIAAPLISIFYTTLILYSYRIHHLLAKYLREVIEPELSHLCDIHVDIEWETWYTKYEVPGIRKLFFLISLWVICILSPLYVAFFENWVGTFILPLIIIGAVYLIAATVITIIFRNG